MNSANRVQIEGIVLRMLPYKERDAILSVALPDRIVSVFARGVQSQKSKNRRLCNPYSTVKLEVFERRDAFSLISGQLVEYAYWIVENLEANAACLTLVETILPDTMNPIIYECFSKCLQAFAKGNNPGFEWACRTLFEVIRAKGIVPFLDGCVSCGSRKNLVTLSLEEGGFLCRECAAEGISWPKKRLRFFHDLSRRNQGIYDSLSFYHQFLFLCLWYEYHQDVRLRGFSFLQQIGELGPAPENGQGNEESRTDIA